jgi:galactokinase
VSDALAARATRVAADFERRSGRPAEGVWAAPGRVNLIGEHTDYNDGLVLPFAIDRHALVAAAPTANRTMRCWSQQYPDEGGSWRRYPAAVAAALGEAGLLPAGFGVDLLVDSDVPVGAGLASSAALEVALALALLDLAGRREWVADEDVARLCQRAENAHIGAPTGLLDPMASLFGRRGQAYLLDCRDLRGQHVRVDLDGLGLLVLDTGVQHAVADGAYAERRAACDRAAELLGVRSLRDARIEDLPRLPDPERRRARHVLTENDRVRAVAELLRAGRTAEIGGLLDASHQSLQTDFEVSCEELDVATAAARAGGAAGARMTGAGFGGSAIALVPAERVEAVTGAVAAAFRDRGWQSLAVFPVSPAAGARRIA